MARSGYARPIPSALLAVAFLAACEGEPGGLFSDAIVAELKKLAHPPATPPPDRSNRYLGNPAAIALGRKFYFDADFAGPASGVDMLLRPLATPGRVAAGQPTGVACNTCHEAAKGGSDHTASPPGHVVSFGGGAYDVNGEQTLDAAYGGLIYWNGRNDSLWSQIVAVVESWVSVSSSRLRVAWRIADAYRAEYTAVFGADYPLPTPLDSVAAQKARLEADGTCKLVAGACPPELCHTQSFGGQTACLPRFPLEARPGFILPGQLPVCDFGSTDTVLQPYRDAYDCMVLDDQLAATRIYVNFAKAIAAYEYTLLTPDAPFDRWVDEGPATSMSITAAARRGARLFVGPANCKQCHSGPLLTDQDFHDIGVPQLGPFVPTPADCPSGGFCDCVSSDVAEPTNCLPWGQRDGLRKLQANRFRRDSRWSDDEQCYSHFTLHNDSAYANAHPEECGGLAKFYGIPLTDDMKGRWKTPGLRNVELTEPYMHTGAFVSLRDVMKHYNGGGMADQGVPVGVLDEKIKKLNLADTEMDDLVEFLKTLTAPVDPTVTAAPTVPPPSGF